MKNLLLSFLIWFALCSGIDFHYKNIITDEPLSVHILEINPKKYKIVPALADNNKISRDTVLNIAKKHHAKAAVNGGFFKMGAPLDGLPVGILKIEGKWLSLSQKQRAAIGWNKNCGFFLIDRVDAKACISFDSHEFPIDGINRERKEYERVLYLTDFFGTFNVNSSLKSYKIISNGCFLALPPYDSLINILRPDNFNYLIYIGSLLKIENSNIWQQLDNIVGGTPVLIFDGKKIYDYTPEKTRPQFLSRKYARTAIGMKENGNLVFLAADGNDPDCSLGLTMDELRDLLFDLGCIYALNLDGGGSSTMVIDDIVINNPKKDEDEDSGTRKVSDAILIIEN